MSNKDREASDATSEKPAGKKGGGMKIVLMVGGIVLALVGAGLGATMGPSLLGRPASGHGESRQKASSHEEHDTDEGEEPKGGGEEKIGHSLVLDPILVDIREPEGEVHHIKVGIALEFVGEMKEEELHAFKPRAKDAAITYLRTLEVREAADPQRLERIRSELFSRIRKAIGKHGPKKIFFTEYVVQ